MRTKFISFLTILATTSLMSFANDEIPLRQGSIFEPGEPTNPRSIECEVMASTDGQVVTASYSELVASQIVVKNTGNQIVFDQTYAPACSVEVNITSLPIGSYTIYIYVMDNWWYGQFEIE